jgi:hypothetical protein
LRVKELISSVAVVDHRDDRRGDIAVGWQDIKPVWRDGYISIIRVDGLQIAEPGENVPSTDPKISLELVLIPRIALHHSIRRPQKDNI